MALVECSECRKEISDEAEACPSCGNPNEKAVIKKQNSGQAMGCLFMILAIPAVLLLGPFAAVVFIVGLVLVLLNTRLA